jgi:hypothetical protein
MRAVSLLVASGDYERAKRLLAAATVVSRKTRDPVLIKQVRQRSKSIADAQAQDAKMAEFAAILKTSPDDPAANLKMGRYLCLIKGDWKRGLPMLAQSNDNALKALAQQAIT